MLRNILSNIAKDCKVSQVRYSALFVNGAKATEQFVYVTPHVDTADLLKHKENIQQQIDKRKSTIDIDKIDKLWTVYEELKSQKSNYETKKSEISQQLAKLLKSDPNSDETKKLKIQIDLIKDNIKKLKIPLWSAEEAAMVEALKLPNNLHANTPTGKCNIIFTHLSPPKHKKSHLKIGKELNIINFKKNENYYLTGEAAIFELGAKFYFNNILKCNNFIQFSNTDFVKSLVVEGCGNDHTSPDTSFILHHNEETKVNKDSRLHLTGGATLSSFMAYHTKNVLYPKVLPLKYFTMGRQYTPSPSDEDSLFHVSQSSVVEIFGVTKSNNDLDKLLNELTNILKTAYTKLGYHFRLVNIPAERLQMWESLRLAVEMYSTSLGCYIEVGNISLSGDFISKRLMLTYVEDKVNKYPYILSGTMLNIPKFLGCVLEQDEDFRVPELFKVDNWILQSC